MSFFSREDLRFLREALSCETLDLDVRESWSSRHRSSRADIRAELSRRLQEDLTDLSAPPRSNKSSISISHCREVGGFALAPSAFALGFDVEEIVRVRKAVIAKVSEASEITLAPSLAALWAAKEAAFKAMSSHVEVISEISIGHWRPRLVTSDANLSDVFDFRLAGKLSNPQTTPESPQGVVFTREGLVFALFLKAPADISQLRSGATEKSYIQGGV